MTDRKALVRMQQAITPFDVYVKDASASVAPDYDARYSNSVLTFQIRYGLKGDAERLGFEGDDEERINLLRYLIDTGVRFVDESAATDTQDPSNEKEPVVRGEITATWLVEYQILKPEDVDEAGIQAFSENNVMYHLWPYWREFIHATSARLRLPQIVLPTYRLQKAEERAERTANTDSTT